MRRLLYELSESFRIAWTQIRANKMRSSLTALGVIIGIIAVTLMGTAILGIDAGVEKSLAGFGDDVLYVTKWPWRDASNDWWNYRNRPPIKPAHADRINEWIESHPGGPLKLAVPAADWNSATIVRGEYRVTNIHINGYGAAFPRIMRADMKEGRFFTEIEANNARNVLILGVDIANALFPNESPEGKTVQMRSQQFTVIGVAARQGSFLGLFSLDSMAIMPINTFRRYFPINSADPSIRVQVDVTRLEESKEELRGLMRRIRQLGPEKKDDFEINSQQVVREQLEPIKKGIAIAGLFITSLALFVGAIGIMNITYVSVKERTKEIGTRKALGARRRTILLQFLIEAVSICLVGGVGGLMSAWGLAAIVGQISETFPLVFSPLLVGVGLFLSVMTGVLSGFIPALQASKLDPVEALRYE
ncbi:MAG: ABC transporter permease [Verrucomicrobia bacterium]|nr:ABC transporter permease [Verrucomicrobiota bacterium]